jgi:hypothetical protein
MAGIPSIVSKGKADSKAPGSLEENVILGHFVVFSSKGANTYHQCIQPSMYSAINVFSHQCIQPSMHSTINAAINAFNHQCIQSM